MPESAEKPFSLTKEQLDSLRLETQSLSPREKEAFTAVVSECHRAFLSSYGGYISEEQDSTIAEKFLVMDKDRYERFYKEWSEFPIAITYTPEEDDRGYGRYFSEAGRVVAGYIPDLWTSIPEQNQKKLIERTGNLKKARQYVENIVTRYIVTHYIAHMYQDPNIPLWFMECGAYYYARSVMREKKWGDMKSSSYDPKADFYQILIDKYGGGVHKISFGQPIDEERKQEVFAEFTDEVRNSLFPDYRITVAGSK